MQNIKKIIINGQLHTFAITLETPEIYRKAFKKDVNVVLNEVDSKSAEGLAQALYVTFPQIIWALAKTADSSIPSIKKWYKQLGPINCINVCEELKDLFPDVGVMNNV